MDIITCKRGFSMVELLISLGLLLLVLGLSFNLYFYSTQSFNMAETRWIAQQNARLAADFITNELSSAYYLEIDPTAPDSDIKDDDNYIYVDENGDLVYQQGKEVQPIVEGNYNLRFAKYVTDGEEPIDNVLSFDIGALDENDHLVYKLDSSVMLANMLEGRGTSDVDSGAKILYRRTDEVTPLPSPSVDCFIATAAYDSKMAPSLTLLRIFRDQYLLTNPPGRAFVRLYYYNSPPVAAYITGSEPLKFIVKVILLPVVGAVFLLINQWFAFAFCFISTSVYLIHLWRRGCPEKRMTRYSQVK
ncbi:MAG: hypothetical protein MJA84_18250 [Firmicutes bacterium]|nr:hypothetical protein [Bacillota bacterium]